MKKFNNLEGESYQWKYLILNDVVAFNKIVFLYQKNASGAES